MVHMRDTYAMLKMAITSAKRNRYISSLISFWHRPSINLRLKSSKFVTHFFIVHFIRLYDFGLTFFYILFIVINSSITIYFIVLQGISMKNYVWQNHTYVTISRHHVTVTYICLPAVSVLFFIDFYKYETVIRYFNPFLYLEGCKGGGRWG